MRSLIPAVLAIAAVGVAPAAAGAATDKGALEPAPLFTSVCVQGGGRMPAGALAPRRYLALPMGARVALGAAVPKIDWRGAGMLDPLGPGEAPNTVDAVGGSGDIYLLLPAVGQRGAMAASCAVAWRGAHFDDARKAIRDITGLDQEDDSRVAGIRRVDVTGDGFRMAAAEAQGWTVLRATPDGDAHAAPIASGSK